MPRPPLPLGAHGKITTWKDGASWTARTKFRDLDGQTRFVKRAAKTKAGAERALKEALVERRTPVAGALVKPETKLGKVAELYFTDLQRAVDDGRRSPGTLDTYRTIYRVHVEPLVAELLVCEASTPIIDQAIDTIRRKSVARARTSKVILSGIMGLAARHGATTTNPVREVARIEGKPKAAPRSLTAAERDQWLKAIDASALGKRWDLGDLTLMMLATGTRIGETLAIGWTEIDLDDATVDICWRLIRVKGKGLLRLPSTKTGARGERVIPLPTWAVDMLRARREAIGDGVEPVFPDALGGWRDPANVRRVWRTVRDQAEMAGLVSHHLRKTVASFLDDNDVSTRKISDQLGHARVSMTQDTYLGRKLTDRQTADVLEGIIPKREERKAEEDRS